MKSYRKVAAVSAIVIVSLSLSITVVDTGNKQEVTTVSVPSHPSDDRLQREDEVVVRNSSNQLAANLSLIVHRVDALVAGDSIRSRFVLNVGGRNSLATRARFPSDDFYRMGTTSQQLLGFPDTRPDQTLSPLALASSPPGSRNATISLPHPQQVRTNAGFSYEFIVAHEIGNVVDISKSPSKNSTELPVTTDTILAYTALNEGSANQVGARYVQQYGGTFDAEEMKPDSDDHWRTRVTAHIYYDGYRYVSARGLNGSEKATVSSTAEILHPEANRTVWQLPKTTFEQRLDSVSEPVATNRAGELLIQALLIERGSPPPLARRVAAGWRNGRIDRYATDNGNIAVWTTEWANETAAASFTETYVTRVPATNAESFDKNFDIKKCRSKERIVERSGKRVTVVSCD